ncbi:hypothetical protein K461DRAFT_61161 [Myriangium duriaei CBS 260.36]|uniref:Uncharacterized protein n=1 Tax=Myriangium duriaei CBS 260.36 TaxID=1168546 RepID=A0A9P4MC47_9PEZI|nr:hypothetical protein K461DRAFT_61161 [Myriangium duriaei CBS 260.36]
MTQSLPRCQSRASVSQPFPMRHKVCSPLPRDPALIIPRSSRQTWLLRHIRHALSLSLLLPAVLQHNGAKEVCCISANPTRLITRVRAQEWSCGELPVFSLSTSTDHD